MDREELELRNRIQEDDKIISNSIETGIIKQLDGTEGMYRIFTRKERHAYVDAYYALKDLVHILDKKIEETEK